MDESNASLLLQVPLGESPELTPWGGLFTGTPTSGNQTRRLAGRSWSCARRLPRSWMGRFDTALGLGSRRVGEHMIEAPVPPPQPIAAVLADVDGILVTSAKAVTTRAIEAIEKLHQRGVLFAITSGRPPHHQWAPATRHAHADPPTGDARADGRLQRRHYRAAGHDHR